MPNKKRGRVENLIADRKWVNEGPCCMTVPAHAKLYRACADLGRMVQPNPVAEIPHRLITMGLMLTSEKCDSTAPESQLSQWQSRRSTDIQKEKGPNEKREPFRRRAPAAPLLGWPFSCESSRRLFGVGFPGQMRYWSVVFHVFACAFSFRFPTRIWSSHLMIFVHPIWSSLRLSCSNVLQSSIERSSSFSCEKQIVRLDPRSVLSRSDGSLLTGRRFVSFPSDGSYMRPHPESHQGENINLSTGHPLSGGKHLSIWWIKSSF